MRSTGSSGTRSIIHPGKSAARRGLPSPPRPDSRPDPSQLRGRWPLAGPPEPSPGSRCPRRQRGPDPARGERGEVNQLLAGKVRPLRLQATHSGCSTPGISARMIDPWAPCWDTPGRPSFPLTAVSGSPDTLLYPREAASREPWHPEGGRARPREANSYHRGPACLSR